MEKSQTQATVSVADSQHDDNGADSLASWLPGYWKRFPYLGVASLFSITVLAAIALGILCGSDNVSTSVWPQKIAPNVVLSMVNALSSLALMVAIGEGVAIAWWRHAMHGSTIAELHHSWELSTGLFRLLFQPKSSGKTSIALAMLAGQVTILNSILYQRATSTYIGPDPPKNLSAIGIAAQEFPMTGYVVSNTSIGAQTSCACFMIGDNFTPVVNTWEISNGFWHGYNELFRFSDKRNKMQYCTGVCYSHIQAIGFEIDCVDSTNHTDIAVPAVEAYKNGGNSSIWTDVPIFNSSFALEYLSSTRNTSQIILNLQYFQSDDPYNPKSTTCPGTVFNKQCTLRPALIEYPVKVTNFTNEHVINGVSLGTRTTDHDDPEMNIDAPPPVYDTKLKQATGYRVVEYLYPQDYHSIGSLTALGGIANALSQFLSSTALITLQSDGSWSLDQKGTLAQTMMYGPPNMGSCDCSFRNDALDVIISGINQLTFLTATGMIDNKEFKGLPHDKQAFPSPMPSASMVAVDSNTTVQFSTLSGTAVQMTDVVHYKTHYAYAGTAFAITMLCILLVVPSFWKYGELGRRVTLGPMEIASAFGAPVLVDDSQTEKAETIDHLIKNIGDRKIQYGFVDVDGDGLVDDYREMHLQGQAVAGIATQKAATQTSAQLSPDPSEPYIGGTSQVQKRKSVRLAIGSPNLVRPTSQLPTLQRSSTTK